MVEGVQDARSWLVTHKNRPWDSRPKHFVCPHNTRAAWAACERFLNYWKCCKSRSSNKSLQHFFHTATKSPHRNRSDMSNQRQIDVDDLTLWAVWVVQAWPIATLFAVPCRIFCPFKWHCKFFLRVWGLSWLCGEPKPFYDRIRTQLSGQSLSRDNSTWEWHQGLRHQQQWRQIVTRVFLYGKGLKHQTRGPHVANGAF